MDIQKIKKIVNSILQDKITAEDCRDAIKELDALKQAETDLQKVIAPLYVERDNLLHDLEKAKKSIKEAKIISEEIVSDAQKKANDLLGDSQNLFEIQQKQHEKEIFELKQKIKNSKKIEDELNLKIQKAQSEYDDIMSKLNDLKKMLSSN